MAEWIQRGVGRDHRPTVFLPIYYRCLEPWLDSRPVERMREAEFVVNYLSLEQRGAGLAGKPPFEGWFAGRRYAAVFERRAPRSPATMISGRIPTPAIVSANVALPDPVKAVLISIMRMLVTGSSGLIGSEAVLYFAGQGHQLFGIDNNLRRFFFGQDGDTGWVLEQLKAELPGFVHIDRDIRDRQAVLSTIEEIKPEAIIHCAAQPSHDLAARMPFEDFDTNAVGTLNLLEAARRSVPGAPFVFMSTNKVYGDAPNRIRLRELDRRWDYDDPAYADGIAETFSIDSSLHSLFGASKVAADVMCQEYGRYFDMPVGIFRGGCLTGVNHSGAELHGFLAYFFKAAQQGRRYTIFGYKGKQVRDQIHSHDVVRAFEEFIAAPRPGEVYNLGGGKANSVSILEAIDRVEQALGKTFDHVYSDENRIGDHICYYSDLSKLRSHYPGWDITRSLDDIFDELARAVAAS